MSPLAAVAPAALHDPEFAERFRYWTGASGRRYICTVYGAAACPPLPGAVFVAVRRDAGGRQVPTAVGRFAAFHYAGGGRPGLVDATSGEIHVHLLARGDQEAEAARRDLAAALAAGRGPANRDRIRARSLATA